MSASRSLTISRYDEKRCNRLASVYITHLFQPFVNVEAVEKQSEQAHPRHIKREGYTPIHYSFLRRGRAYLVHSSLSSKKIKERGRWLDVIFREELFDLLNRYKDSGDMSLLLNFVNITRFFNINLE